MSSPGNMFWALKRAWLGLVARKFLVGKGNASCFIPPPQLSFISDSAEMMALDQSRNRQQQAIVKGSLKQGNDRIMPRHCL